MDLLLSGVVEVDGKHLMREQETKSCRRDRSLLWLLEVEREEE